MTKPGFIKRRILALFNSDDIKEQNKIIMLYNKIRNDKCYCGHTIDCDCGNPDISNFKTAIENNYISEHTLNKIL